MTHPTIALIGAGNMGGALIEGLIASGTPANSLWVSSPEIDRLKFLQAQYGLHTATDNQMAAKSADIIILAIKPQIILSVLTELSDIIHAKKPLLISIAGGITEPLLCQTVGNQPAIIRA